MGHVESQPQVRRSDAAKEIGEPSTVTPRYGLRIRWQAVHILDHERNTLPLGVFDSARKGFAQRGPHTLEKTLKWNPQWMTRYSHQGSREIDVLFQVLLGGLSDRRHDLRAVNEGGGVETAPDLRALHKAPHTADSLPVEGLENLPDSGSRIRARKDGAAGRGENNARPGRRTQQIRSASVAGGTAGCEAWQLVALAQP